MIWRCRLGARESERERDEAEKACESVRERERERGREGVRKGGRARDAEIEEEEEEEEEEGLFKANAVNEEDPGETEFQTSKKRTRDIKETVAESTY